MKAWRLLAALSLAIFAASARADAPQAREPQTAAPEQADSSETPDSHGAATSPRTGAVPDDIEPEAPSELQAPFTLIVNHVHKGEILVVLRDDRVLVRRADLEAAGVRAPQGRQVQAFGESWLSLASVSPPLRYELDEAEIALRVSAPVELLPRATLDLGGKPQAIEYRRDTSAFLNYAPRLTDFNQLDVYSELGLSVDGHLLFNSTYLSSERKPIRGLTQLTLDDRIALRRTTLGDAFVQLGPLGSGNFLGGVTIARRYELDPYLVRAPSLGYAGSTLTPATLDVYVNGSRVRSEPLSPGTFRLDNLRVGGGRGVATYVIRDIFGHEESVAVPFYIASGALAEGLDEYTYSIGRLRSGVGFESWDYGAGAAMGRHRLGISDQITVGGRIEATQRLVSAGPSITALTPIGQLELDVGTSQHLHDGGGFAAFLSYAFVSRVFGAGAFARLQSDRYATLDQAPADDRATVDVGAFQSTPLGPRLSLLTQGSVSSHRDTGTVGRFSLQAIARLASAWFLIASGGQSYSRHGSPWELMLTLNVSLPEGHNASVAGRVTQGDPSLLLNINKSLPVGEGFGYRASSIIAEHSRADVLAQYQSLVGRYGVQYSTFDAQHQVSLDAAGAIAIVPGVGVFPTLPVQDGYGVIRLPGVNNVRGYVNNHEIGRTNRDGNMLVPSLLSYYGNRLSIAQEDVPLQYSLSTTELTLAPPSRGVAIAEFPVTIPHFYRGTLVIDDQGRRVIPKYGQVSAQSPRGALISPIGELGEFEIDGLPIGRNTLMIEYMEGTCELHLQIAETRSVVVELGEVVCEKR